MMNGQLLIIDDEPDILTVLSHRLRKTGYRVAMTRDGATALDMVKELCPDLVLLDIHMPRLDGVEPFRVMLEIDPYLGVIIMTGDVRTSLAKLIKQEGAWDFVAKPIDLDYLTRSIANILIRRKYMGPYQVAA